MFQVFRPVQHTVGVVGVAQADHPGLGGDVGLQLGKVNVAVLQLGGEQDNLTPCRQTGLPEQVVHRIKHNHLIPGLQHHIGNHIHAPGRAVNGQHQFRVNVFSLAPLQRGRTTPLTTSRPIRICLDAGHGGQDVGATSPDGRTHEKTITLDIARRVERLLRKDGFEVLLTRRDNQTTQQLAERPFKAYRWRADAFVSIHLNSSSTPSARGVETYVLPALGMESSSYHENKPSKESTLKYPGNASDVGNVQLGFAIQRRLLGATGLEDRGLRRARFVVLREASMPAALVECAFLTASKDLAFLRSEAGRDKIARGIYEGIADWAYGTFAPGLPPHQPGTFGKRFFPKTPPAYTAAAPAPAPQGAAKAPVPIPATFPRWQPAPAPTDPRYEAARRKAMEAAGIATGNKPVETH